MFLEELNELFRENWSKFLTAGYLVFLKQFPAAGSTMLTLRMYVQVLTLFYSLTSTDSAGGGRSAFTPRGIPLNVYVQKPSTQHS